METPDRYARKQREAQIRCYAELNDFLPEDRRQREFACGFTGTPSVKDLIESLGVPHTEIDVILVDGRSVDFAHRLRGGERVAVYPTFERYDVAPLTRDKGILKNGRVTHGYWLRATDAEKQLQEVVRALDLSGSIRPYTRCMQCNGELEPMGRADAAKSVPLQVFLVYREFKRCIDCGRVYWPGSHVRRLDRIVERARSGVAPDRGSCK